MNTAVKEPQSESAFIKKMRFMLRRRPIRDLLVALFDHEGVLGLEDGHMGAVFIGDPLSGADDSTVDRIKGAFTGDIPAGTHVQFTYLRSRDISEIIRLFRLARAEAVLQNDIPSQLESLIDREVALYEKGTESYPIKGLDCLIGQAKLIVSVKVPLKGKRATVEEMVKFKEFATQISSALGATGMRLSQLDGKGYVLLMRRIFQMFNKDVPDQFQDDRLLRDQIAGPGDSLDVKFDRVHLNNQMIKLMSVKMRPEVTSLIDMGYLVGDPNGSQNQIGVPFMMTTTIHFPDRISESGKLRGGSTMINYQAFGPMMRWAPILAQKKMGFDILVEDLDQGEVPVHITTSLALFAREGEEELLNEQVGRIRAYFAGFEYVMAEEKRITLPVFLNMLPLQPNAETEKGLERFESMTMREAVHLLPILGDWRGTGINGALLGLSRRNQPILFDLWDSPTSRNAVVIGGAGGGKSFTVNKILKAYLSLGMGTRAWVIDNGYSYYKLCKYLGGEYIDFTDDSGICLNPFSNIDDLNDEAEYLRELVSVMASPSGELDDYAKTRIEEGIRATFGSLHQRMTISDLAQWLTRQPDPISNRIGTMLFPFTRSGAYGRWFDGVNNLNMDRRLVVLELANLNSRRHLQKVVLFQLMDRVGNEMYLGGQDVKKLIVVDEAADQLKDGDMSVLLEGFYRKVRKNKGASILAMQLPSDLHQSAAGKAIAANAPFKFYLQQESEVINEAEKNGYIETSAWGYAQLRSLRVVKGKFGEVFLSSPTGSGVIRLVEDRFTQVLFSSDDRERYEIMAAIQAGRDAAEVINEFIARNG